MAPVLKKLILGFSGEPGITVLVGINRSPSPFAPGVLPDVPIHSRWIPGAKLLNPDGVELLTSVGAVPSPSSATPQVESGSGAAGSSLDYSRGDHVHPEGPANPALSNATPQVESGAGAAGSSGDASRADHVHPEGPANPALSNATPQVESGAGAAGSASTCSRSDHVHPEGPANPALSNATPLVESGAGSSGSASDCSRSDHVHPEVSGQAISGLKNATVVASGSSVFTASGQQFDITLEAAAGHRFYFTSIYPSAGGSVSGGRCVSSLSATYLNQHTFHLIWSGTLSATATVQYKVYRIDET